MWYLVAVLIFTLFQETDPAAAGLKALEAQDYTAAAQQFSRAVEADPKDYAARFHLALANSLLGKTAEAIAGYKTVLELKPGLYEAQANLGKLLVGQKQPREAVPILEAAVAQKPESFSSNFFLAESLLAVDEPAKAETYFASAARLDPKSAPAELGLARARARQNRLEEASTDFRRAAELDPDYKDALLELASLYESAGRGPEAIALYNQFPENDAARERLALLLIKSGKPAEAVPLLEQLLAKQPQDLALRMMYGRTLRDLKNYAAAAAEFNRVVQAKPELVEAWSELAGVLILTGDYPRGLAALDRIRALGAESAGHLYLRAIILDKARQLRPALESYQKFLAMSQGKSPDEEFKARQRARILEKELNGR
jgi:tetratricopeptide (TPR) repeat protein